MLDAITDILTDALVLLPLLVVVVVVIGLISWAVNLFCSRPGRGLSLFSSEGKTARGKRVADARGTCPRAA
jgi:uncharacterized protein HemY